MCILCDSTQKHKISDNLRHASKMSHGNDMKPYQCDGCKLVFLYPLMDEKTLDWFYEKEYRKIYHGDYDINNFHKNRFPDAKRRADKILSEKLAKNILVDVGSSTASFLELVQARINTVIGIEPDKQQSEFANKNGITTYPSINMLPDNIKADTITLFHVLEHINNPVEFLRELSQHLAPNGILIVEVPNVDDVLLSKYEIPEFEAFYWHPAHSYYFSKDTLRRVAEQAGFTNIRVEPVQRYSLQNHLHWAIKRGPQSSDQSLMSCLNDIISPETSEKYSQDLCDKFLCDTLWMVATREI